MLFQPLRAPMRALRRPAGPAVFAPRLPQVLSSTPSTFTPSQVPNLSQVRHATHGVQGRANGPKNGAGRRLGAKKTGDEYVIPGNIIFRQRGTNWHPGHNVGMGRDHTIFALQTGFVKYYRDPKLHAKRRYIGVTFERHETLPVNPTAPRRRRLGMLAVPRAQSAISDAEENDVGVIASTIDPSDVSGAAAAQPLAASPDPAPKLSPAQRKEAKRRAASGRLPASSLQMRPNYSYRESNFDIGRSAERAGVKVKEFIPGDRFRAWRKTNIRRKRRAEKNAIGRKKPSDRKAKRK